MCIVVLKVEVKKLERSTDFNRLKKKEEKDFLMAIKELVSQYPLRANAVKV